MMIIGNDGRKTDMSLSGNFRNETPEKSSRVNGIRSVLRNGDKHQTDGAEYIIWRQCMAYDHVIRGYFVDINMGVTEEAKGMFCCDCGLVADEVVELPIPVASLL